MLVKLFTCLLMAAAEPGAPHRPTPAPGGKSTLLQPVAATPAQSPLRAPGGSTVWTRGEFRSIQVNVNVGGQNIMGDAANQPSIAVDPTDPLRIVIGWRQFDTVASGFRQAAWAYSHDGGESWTFPGVLEPGVFRTDPVLAADAEGNFYYYSLGADLTCKLFKSLDGGVTWLPGVPAFGGEKPWMTTDRTDGIGHGNIYAAWGSGFTRSTDSGATFTGVMGARTDSGTIEVGPGGEVYVVSERGVNFFRSDDAQDPFAEPHFVLLSWPSVMLQGPSGTCPVSPTDAGDMLGRTWVSSDHSSGQSRGYVYLLSVVDPLGRDSLDIAVRRSTNRGNTWNVSSRINDDSIYSCAWQWLGSMSIAPNGRIDVTWLDTRNDSTATHAEIFYAFSINAGWSWSRNVPVSLPFDHRLGTPQGIGGMGDYNHMCSDNSGVSLAYTATFNGEQDIYFLRIVPDCNSNGVPDGSEISYGSSNDCTQNGLPDECEPDCDANGVADSCDLESGVYEDCNNNGIPDDCDLSQGYSHDCDGDVTPDDCQTDCNANRIADACDVSAGSSPDADGDGTPDECEGPVVVSLLSRWECDLMLPLAPSVGTEPRLTRVAELIIGFDQAPGRPTPGVSPVLIDEKVCPPPGEYRAFTGTSQVMASVSGTELVLKFVAPLPNARTYRITLGPEVTTLGGQFVEVRCLTGDVNGDGRVNATDRSMVVGVWTGGGRACVTDILYDEQTNQFDRDIVVGAWVSGQNCAP